MTWSSNQIIQMINIMSPITTSIRTITRKSVNMVAELDIGTAPSRIPDTTDCLEDLKAKDESQLAETHQTEATASQNFQMPQQSLKDEMKFNAQDLEAAKHSFGEVQGQLTTDTSRSRGRYSSTRRHNARLPGNPSKGRGIRGLQQESV